MNIKNAPVALSTYFRKVESTGRRIFITGRPFRVGAARPRRDAHPKETLLKTRPAVVMKYFGNMSPPSRAELSPLGVVQRHRLVLRGDFLACAAATPTLHTRISKGRVPETPRAHTSPCRTSPPSPPSSWPTSPPSPSPAAARSRPPRPPWPPVCPALRDQLSAGGGDGNARVLLVRTS